MKKRAAAFFHLVWNWRKYRKFKGFEKKLEVVLLKQEKERMDREVDQIILKHEIVKHMKMFMKVNARSRYIPRNPKSKEICRQEVFGIFGERMAKLGIGLKQDL
ncbi:MAG: hypothetical protein V4581_14380, partial [Bacteroidota bacterium]